MHRWLSLFRRAGSPWTLLLSFCFLLIGFIIVGYSGFQAVSHELAYHSYKANGLSTSKKDQTIKQTKTRLTHNPPRLKMTGSNSVSYPTVPKLGESLGELVLPKLKVDLPIVEGAKHDQLAKGVGHFQKSVLPGEANNCVLSGHRDTVFRHLGDLKIGDDVVVRTKVGTFVYRIKKIRIVDQSDRTVIVSTRLPTLTLTTCYPFHFIGNAPKRYIIIARLQPAKSQVYV